MGSFSIWHWIIIVFWPVVVLVPGWRIAAKASYHGAWSLLLLVPIRWPVAHVNQAGGTM